MKKALLVLLLVLLAVPFAAAVTKEGSMKLLAVSEGENATSGSIADLHLEIMPGSGRVFIDSFPLTKIDTQITTRFANQIACSYLENDCTKYDFFYTIKADSSIVGGPSAGAATAILTIALLNDLSLKEGVAITGTINSGDVVGSVGGLKEKIDAAASAGIKEVLIPEGERYTVEGNSTIDAVEYGQSNGVKVVEVSDLDEAMYEFTGMKLRPEVGNLTVSKEYTGTMRNIAEELCNKSSDILITVLQNNYDNRHVLSNDSLSLEEEAFNLTDAANSAFSQERYYSAASFCYGAALAYEQIKMNEENLTLDDMENVSFYTQKTLSEFENGFNSKTINTITDLETSMIVNERIQESYQNLDDTRSMIKQNNTKQARYLLASALVRMYSAQLWAEFFGKSGLKVALDNETLKDSCQKKISEAEERYQYVGLYFPDILGGINDEITSSYSSLQGGKYAMCLFQASKAKADADAILSSMSTERLDILLNEKLKAAKQVIARQISRGLFPIFGYSYFEYADTLRNDNVASALVYAEYAIELSNLDMYFKSAPSAAPAIVPQFQINYDMVPSFILGVGIGMLVSVLVFVLLKKAKKRSRKR